MTRFLLFVAVCTLALQACAQKHNTAHSEAVSSTMWFNGQDSLPKVILTDQEWKDRLSPSAYGVLRNHDTERPFTCAFLEIKEEGNFFCAGCGLHLFATEDKFDSGTGWPSYGSPVNEHHVINVVDKSAGMVRTEVRCAQCDGHLGHVFDDGPPPTGLRYCINGVALKFEALN